MSHPVTPVSYSVSMTIGQQRSEQTKTNRSSFTSALVYVAKAFSLGLQVTWPVNMSRDLAALSDWLRARLHLASGRSLVCKLFYSVMSFRIRIISNS